MLRLNLDAQVLVEFKKINSNTTNVKVKRRQEKSTGLCIEDSNTTNVKVKHSFNTCFFHCVKYSNTTNVKVKL